MTYIKCLKTNNMIHGTSVFSMADLNGNNGHLYGKYKKGKNIIDVECLEENEADGTTYVRTIHPAGFDHVKTSKLYDLHHSNDYIY